MIAFLRGKKTYIMAIGWIAWGLWNYVVDGNATEGLQRVMEGVSLIALRAGVTKSAAPAQ